MLNQMFAFQIDLQYEDWTVEKKIGRYILRSLISSSAKPNFRDNPSICCFKMSIDFMLADNFSSKNSLSFSAVEENKKQSQT